MLRLLLWLFPPAFRRRFGADVLEVLGDRCDEARRAGGRLGLARALAAAFLDTLVQAAGEWRTAATRRTPARPAAVLPVPAPPFWSGHVDQIVRDVRQATRWLVHRPGLTVAAVLTLALGVGVNTALFSLLEALVLRPLPLPSAERVMWLESVNTTRAPGSGVSYPDLDDWRRRARTVEAIGGFSVRGVNLSGGAEPVRVETAFVTASCLDVLGIRPILGRLFSGERVAGDARSVLLSEGLWRRAFGGDPSILGRQIVVDGEPHEVLGVVPVSSMMQRVELWISLPLGGAALDRSNRSLQAIARVRPGVRVEQTRDELDRIARALERERPATNTAWTVRVTPLHEWLVQEVGPVLGLLAATTWLVLLIACANVANLLLARAVERRSEIAVRRALGAGRLRLLRQLLTESLLIGLVGGAVAVVLAAWITGVANAWQGDSAALFKSDLAVNGSVLAFAAIVSIVTGLLVGLAPALVASGWSSADAPRSGGARGADRRGSRLRTVFAAAQITVCTILLVGAGLLTKSLYRSLAEDPGLEPRHALAMSVSLPRASYRANQAVVAFVRGALARLERVPGVEAAGASTSLPGGRTRTFRGYVRGGEPRPEPSATRLATYRAVTPGFLRAAGLTLVAGRDFTHGDRGDTEPVAIVNRSMARRLWPDGSPVGRRVWIHTDEPFARVVVGVVGDAKQRLDLPVGSEYYVPFDQAPESSLSIVVRLRPDATTAVADLKRTVAAIDATVPLYDVVSLDELLAGSVRIRRSITVVLALLAGLGLTLAALGVYGVVAATVAQRTHEIGVRIAVGASQRDVIVLVLGQGARMAGVALALGTGGALVVARVLGGMLYGVRPADPPTFALVVLLLLVTTLAACAAPARRALGVDPVHALRAE